MHPQPSGYPSPAQLRELEADLLRYFRQRLPTHVDPRDLVAEVWVALADWRGEASARTFCFRVARLRLSSFYRARRDWIYPWPDDDDMVMDADPRPCPEKLLQSMQEQLLLDAALMGLPEVSREVVRLHLEGADNFKIAEQLGLQYNTARSRLSRGLSRLRAVLEQHA